MTRLFEAPAFIAERYTDFQIADATWYILGSASESIGMMACDTVPPELQIRCVRSVTTLYTDLFDRVCGNHGTDPDSDLLDSAKVDQAVYMIWDMSGLELFAMFPHNYPHLVEPAIEILENVLRRCRTSACRISALHGIGHTLCVLDHDGDASIAARLRAIIDEFANRLDVPDWLLKYAMDARSGMVQ